MGTAEGFIHAPGAIKGAPEACTAGRRATPHQNEKRIGVPGRGDTSKFRAQLDELSPGLLKSPLSR